MPTRDADLIIRLVDFSKPMVGSTQYMDKQSFLDNVVNNPYFKARLDAGLIKGLFTHKGREEQDEDKSELPYDDFIANHKDLANVMRDCWVDGNIAYAAIDLLSGTEGGDRAILHLKNKMYIGISMATDCDVDRTTGNFCIKELYGADMTTDPAFIGSGVVEVKRNFSNGKKIIHKLNFSNQSTDSNAIVQENLEKVNFDLRALIRENKRPIYSVLQQRISETIRVLKSMDPDDITENRSFILSYLNDIIFNWMSSALLSDDRINVSLGLRLNRYLDNPKLANVFNRKVNLIKSSYNITGYMTKNNQQALNEVLKELLNSMWVYISKKASISPSLLVPGYNPEEKD